MNSASIQIANGEKTIQIANGEKGTFCVSELAGIEPTPPAPERAGYVSLDHLASVDLHPISKGTCHDFNISGKIKIQ